MKLFFMVSCGVATVLEVIVVIALVRQVMSQGKGEAPSGRLVLKAGELLSAAALFGGAMTVVNVVAHGWDAVRITDVLLFAATFGIVTAAVLERLRTRVHSAQMAAYAIPLGFGIIGGLVGSSL
ncbi:hypothetical protein AB0G73_32000 [Streptomyces sp. NPDC020719]|uniref:hypothetical protein n=1 Tax=Streptomyces sp. NPDC020719 TaxID=3154896 RepID=UPI003404D42F